MDIGSQKKEYVEEDVISERIDHLLEERIPWLFLGLLGGLFATFVVSKFEGILAADVRLAFFIPIIVYLSSAVGTQSETIYVREIAERAKIDFRRYILKETLVGFGLGIISGAILGAIAAYWLGSFTIGFTIGFTMLINLTIAPALAIFVPRVLYKRHADPALGAGPLATIIQDLISLVVYFVVVSFLLF